MNTMRGLLDDLAEGAKHYEVTEAAIRGARRRRRVRTVAPVAAVLAVALVTLGVWLPTRDPGTQRQVPAVRQGSPTGLGVDLVVGTTLYATDGRRVPVPPDVDQAYELPGGGWLVRTMNDTSFTGAVYRIDPDGSRHRLVSHALSLAVDATGTRVAWAAGTLPTSGPKGRSAGHVTLGAATLVDGRLTDRHDTESVPYHGAYLMPELVTADGGVVLRGLSTPPYDVWYPARGAYRPSVNETVLSVSGTVPGTGLVVGLVDGDAGHAVKPCLAKMDPAHDLAVVGETVCRGPFGRPRQGSVSPGGYLLQAGSVSSRSGSGSVIGYQVGAGSMTHRAVWPLSNRFAMFSRADWVDDTTAVIVYYADETHPRLGRLDTTRPGRITPVALPAGAHGHFTPVTPLVG